MGIWMWCLQPFIFVSLKAVLKLFSSGRSHYLLIGTLLLQILWNFVDTSSARSAPDQSSADLSVAMEPGKKKAKVRKVKKKQKSAIKANMTAEQKAEIRIKEKFNEHLDIK